MYDSMTIRGGEGVWQSIMIDDKGGEGGPETPKKVWHNIWTIPNEQTLWYNIMSRP